MAIETAFVHCSPGGAALFAPDHTRETFKASTTHGGHYRGNRCLRYLEWTWDPDVADTTYISDMVYAKELRRSAACMIATLVVCLDMTIGFKWWRRWASRRRCCHLSRARSSQVRLMSSWASDQIVARPKAAAQQRGTAGADTPRRCGALW